MKVEPQQEHRWLERLVGEWTYKFEIPAGPDTPPTTHTGTEHVRSLGGVWAICEGRGEMGGDEPTTTVMTLGYDPTRKCYVGTYVGSMMTHMWVYEGELDSTGQVLTLNTEGPGFTPEAKITKYKDVIEFKSDDHRVLTSAYLDDEGQWHQFMTMNYRRTG